MNEQGTGAVVVGVDGSEESADALALALKLTQPLKCDLAAVFVHPYGPLAATLREPKYEQLVKELADSVHAHMRALELPVPERRLQIVSDRSPAAGLQRIAERDGAALIVVGGSRRSRVGRVLPGGTAERLLAGAPCPLAVAPRGYARSEAELTSVGCAFDGSDESRIALDWARNLTRSLGAQLRLLTVHESLPPVTVPAAAGLPLESVNETLRQQLARELAEAEAELREEGVDVRGELLHGNLVNAIADASTDLDLLVLGSRGYGPLGAVLLGSVSTALVRNSNCPVIVAPRSPVQ
jgi:nucleotide-binding universal stress UspA family protein